MNLTTIDLATSQPTQSDLLKLTAAGNEVVLVNAGEPVARMTSEAKSEATAAAAARSRLPSRGRPLSEDWNEPPADEFWLGGDPGNSC